MHRRQVTRTRMLIIGVATFLAIAAWVGSEIYGRFTTDRVTPKLEEEIKPLQTTFNLKALEEIENKRQIDVDFSRPIIDQIQFVREESPSGTEEDIEFEESVTEVETVTPSTTLQQNTATNSGQPTSDANISQ